MKKLIENPYHPYDAQMVSMVDKIKSYFGSLKDTEERNPEMMMVLAEMAQYIPFFVKEKDVEKRDAFCRMFWIEEPAKGVLSMINVPFSAYKKLENKEKVAIAELYSVFRSISPDNIGLYFYAIWCLGKAKKMKNDFFIWFLNNLKQYKSNES